MRFVAASALALSFVASPVLAVEYVNDPLTASSFTGRGSKGGTFSSSGWTTVDESDAVWYEIPDALPSGRVEYTVTGISTTTTLTGADHDILTIYQAPTGQSEPIAYSPYFRNNDFKAFTRIFGQQEPGRNGAMKLEVAFCPRGDPWYHDSVCPAGCDGSGIGYANGSDKDVGWDGTKSYRMVLEWGGGKFTFYRDQAALGSVSYPGEYAPKPLRVRIGSPRHDGVYPGLAMMPKGITFKDVLVTGTPGTMTPVCGATTPADAGPSDAGTTPDAGPSQDEYTVLADVTAASWESGVFPDVNDLNVEADGSGVPTAVVYLRFPALGAGVQQAVLRLQTAASGSAAGGSGVICAVSDDTWSESTMTWASRPTVATTCVGTPFSVDPDSGYEWDVTSLLPASGSVNLAVVSQDQNGAHYLSKEGGGATLGPRLTVLRGEVPDASGSGGGSGSGGWGSGGAPIEGGTLGGSGGSMSGTSSSDDDGGCGCRTAPGAPRPLWALVLGLSLLAARRRRPGRS